MRDIAAARDLAHSLDRGKDGIHKQLVSATLENDRLIKQLEKYDADKDAAAAQFQAERIKNDRLEQLIASERTRKMQGEMSAGAVSASQSARESQLTQLVQQQQASLDFLNANIDKQKQEINSYQRRIEQLEKVLSSQQEGTNQPT